MLELCCARRLEPGIIDHDGSPARASERPWTWRARAILRGLSIFSTSCLYLFFFLPVQTWVQQGGGGVDIAEDETQNRHTQNARLSRCMRYVRRKTQRAENLRALSRVRGRQVCAVRPGSGSSQFSCIHQSEVRHTRLERGNWTVQEKRYCRLEVGPGLHRKPPIIARNRKQQTGQAKRAGLTENHRLGK